MKRLLDKLLMTTLKQVSFNTVYQIIAKAITSISTLLVTVLITKSFGELGYGQFVIVTSYVALFYLSADFGLNAVTTRTITMDPSKTKQYFQNLLGLRLTLSFAIIILALLIAALLPYSRDLKIGIGLASLTILSQALFVSTNAVFQTKFRYDLSAISDVASAVSILGLVFVVYLSGGSLLQLITVYTLGSFIRVVIGLLLVTKFVGSIGLVFDKVLWKQLLTQALPLGLFGIFSQINGYADKFIMSLSSLPGGMDRELALAYYGLAYKIFEFGLVVPTFFINAAYPVMVRHYQISLSRLAETAKKMYLAMLVLSILASVTGFILAPFVIDAFKKSSGDFYLSVDILRVLLLGLPIFYLSVISVWLLVTMGRQKVLVWIYGIASIVNVALNIIFIPRYGVFASSVITIVSEVVIITLSSYLAFRVMKQG